MLTQAEGKDTDRNIDNIVLSNMDQEHYPSWPEVSNAQQQAQIFETVFTPDANAFK